MTTNAPPSAEADFLNSLDFSNLRVSTDQLGPAEDTVSSDNPYNSYMESNNDFPPDAPGSTDATFDAYIHYGSDHDNSEHTIGGADESGEPSSSASNQYICGMTNSKGQICNKGFPRACDLK